jgi:DNA-binding NarL/FixJ family response regulator
MDGLSAVGEIRRHVPAAETEVLIVSAYDRPEYRPEAVAAGFRDLNSLGRLRDIRHIRRAVRPDRDLF